MNLPSNIKPYYYDPDYQIVIYHGDCRDILPHLPKVDLVLTDPPYGIKKAEWDENFPKWFITEAFKSSQSVCIMPGLWALSDCLDAMGNRYRWVIAGYNKNGMTHGAIGFNNWIPAVCAGVIPHGGQDAYDFTIHGGEKNAHPSQKPLKFMLFLVNRLTAHSNTILDPFMGSGTTLVAALQLGRKAIGIEIEERYCRIAVERLRQTVLPLAYSTSHDKDEIKLEQGELDYGNSGE